MKKNLMSLAVAASVAGVTATSQAAMYLNPENTGQVLLFPFYNAEQGNQTSIHIVNTTGKGKAVKVRFMEYVNSQEVLDFNLYLSEYDHFSMSIFQDPNGTGGAIVTRDNSCTVPALGSANGDYSGSTTTNADGSITRIQPFVPWKYDVTGEAFDSVTRTLVGHVEVIEMGVLGSSDMGTADKTDDVTPNAWATHDATGVPANCAALGATWASGAWATSTAVNTAIDAPSGGLYGISYHLNAADAAAFGIEAAAIESWRTTAKHTEPGSLSPSLTDGDTSSIVPYNGVAKTFTWSSAIDAVSSLFQVSAVMNDVMINSDLNGLTDWVITFPTKRFYVNGTDAPLAPFTKAYSLVKPTTSACEVVTINQWDREEAQTTPVNGFSPPPPGQTAKSICLETNTIAAGSTVSALNASVASATVAGTAVTLPFPYAEGWQKLGFTQAGHVMYPATISGGTVTDIQGSTLANGANAPELKSLQGLPTIGFAAYKYVNGTVTAGALNNYGFTADHKTETSGSAFS